MALLVSVPTNSHAWLHAVDFFSTAFPLIDDGLAVSCDGSGDVFAAGVGGPNFDRIPVLTKRAGDDGKMLWYQTFDSLGCGTCKLSDVLPISDGDQVVAGTMSVVTNQNQFAVARVDGTSGNMLWRFLAPGIRGHATSLVLDASGDVYATGFTEPSTVAEDDKLLVVKLDETTGMEAWSYTVPSSGGGGVTEGADIVFDGMGGLFVGGRVATVEPSGVGTDSILIKLDVMTGAELWRVDDDAGSGNPDGISALGVNDVGDVFAVYHGGLFSAPEVALQVVKFDGSNGTELWRRTLAAPTEEIVAFGLAVDSSGDVVVAGGGRSGSGGRPFLAKIDGLTGADIWSDDPLGYGLHSQWRSLALTATGDVLVTGSNRGVPGDQDMIAARFASDTGSRLSVWYAGGPDFDRGESIVPCGTAGFAVTGRVTQRTKSGDLNVDMGILKVSDLLAGRSLKLKETSAGTTLRLTITDANLLAVSKGLPGDPTADGASLKLINEVTGEEATFNLPREHWTSTARDIFRVSHVYKDKAGLAGACRKVVVKGTSSRGTIRAKCAGSMAFTLDEPTQGELSLRLSIGAEGPIHCVTFDTPSFDDPGRFIARSSAPPDACP